MRGKESQFEGFRVAVRERERETAFNSRKQELKAKQSETRRESAGKEHSHSFTTMMLSR